MTQTKDAVNAASERLTVEIRDTVHRHMQAMHDERGPGAALEVGMTAMSRAMASLLAPYSAEAAEDLLGIVRTGANVIRERLT